MSVDYRELQELQKRMQNFIDHDADKLCRDCANELTMRLYRKIVKNTITGEYEVIVYTKKDGSSKSYNENRHGGTLKRGWSTALNESILQTEGNEYVRILTNNVSYASYYEYGHRQEPGRFVPHIGKRLKQAWVPGKHVVTKAERDIQKIAPALIQKKLDEKMKEMLNGS